jgi:hypothetical protein
LTSRVFRVTFWRVKAMMALLDVARPRVPFDPIAGSTGPACHEAPQP